MNYMPNKKILEKNRTKRSKLYLLKYGTEN